MGNRRGWKSGKIVNESFNCLGLIAKRIHVLARVEMEEISIRNDDRCSCIVYVIGIRIRKRKEKKGEKEKKGTRSKKNYIAFLLLKRIIDFFF